MLDSRNVCLCVLLPFENLFGNNIVSQLAQLGKNSSKGLVGQVELGHLLESRVAVVLVEQRGSVLEEASGSCSHVDGGVAAGEM